MAFLIGPTRQIIQQDPDDNLDYLIDLSDWLGSGTASGVTVIASGVTATALINPTPITVDEYGEIPAARSITLTVSGGTVAMEAGITLRVTTAAGKSLDLSYTVVIKPR